VRAAATLDNGNISTQGPTYQVVEHKLRDYYTECHSWCLRAGLTIKPDKTELIFFSCSCPNPTLYGPRPLTTYLPNWEANTYYEVTTSDQVCYLSLHFNHKLAWDKHIAVVAMRTKGTIKSLQLLSNSVQGLDHGSWCTAFNTICIPALTYGSPIWFRGQKKLIKTLQTVQNMALWVITGAFYSTLLDPLHQLMAIPPTSANSGNPCRHCRHCRCHRHHSGPIVVW
jgi:hypothetical protein